MTKEKAAEIEKNKTQNPKTGVLDFIGLLILSVMCVVLFVVNKDKVSTFKKYKNTVWYFFYEKIFLEFEFFNVIIKIHKGRYY